MTYIELTTRKTTQTIRFVRTLNHERRLVSVLLPYRVTCNHEWVSPQRGPLLQRHTPQHNTRTTALATPKFRSTKDRYRSPPDYKWRSLSPSTKICIMTRPTQATQGRCNNFSRTIQSSPLASLNILCGDGMGEGEGRGMAPQPRLPAFPAPYSASFSPVTHLFLLV